jgi:hypothetical protein
LPQATLAAVTNRWKIVLSVVATVVAAVLVGCAGDGDSPSTQEYEATVIETRDRVDSAMAHMQQATSEDDFLARLDEAGSLVNEAASDFDDSAAPERFEDESERLVGALRALAIDLRATAEQARDLGFDLLLGGASGLNFDSWTKVNTILGDLREQGVEVQPLGRH